MRTVRRPIVAFAIGVILGAAIGPPSWAEEGASEHRVRRLILKRQIEGLDKSVPVPSALLVSHRRLGKLHHDASEAFDLLAEAERRRSPIAQRIAAYERLVRAREVILAELRRHKRDIDRSALRVRAIESRLVDGLDAQIAAASQRLAAVLRMLEWVRRLGETVADTRSVIPDPRWPRRLDPGARGVVESSLKELRRSRSSRQRRQLHQQLVRALETFRKAHEHEEAELRREIRPIQGLRDTREGRTVILAELINECIRLNERFNAHDREILAGLDE